MGPRGIITNIQRFSIHDGPGIRTTVFFKGCPLRCLWCHNPETYEVGRELSHKQEKCIGCGQCIDACENGALTLGTGWLAYDRTKCARCYRCAEICPSKALFICGREMGVAEVVEETLADRELYRSSGGGVTFSGGEASAQSGFLCALAGGLKKEGIHLALDTCGHCAQDIFAKVMGYMDLCLFDIKHADSGKHQELTGAGNGLILKNLLYLDKAGIKTHIRIPVIPGKNDDMENISKIADILKEIKVVAEIDLLGYHPLGMSKIVGFNGRQEDFGIPQPPREELESLRRFLGHKLPGVKVVFR